MNIIGRVLKPFIRRDTESKPLKLRLLQEILEHHQKVEPAFKAPPIAPIDYCYVRPQHIPSINALCREFFWPGIDCKYSVSCATWMVEVTDVDIKNILVHTSTSKGAQSASISVFNYIQQ